MRRGDWSGVVECLVIVGGEGEEGGMNLVIRGC